MRFHKLLLIWAIVQLQMSSVQAQDSFAAENDDTLTNESLSESVVPNTTDYNPAAVELGDEVDEILDLDKADGGESAKTSTITPIATEPVQSGPFIDLFGPTLLSLKMVDSTRAQIVSNYTSDALRGKSVVGVYFSADWCGPCRKFTPELVQFYEKLNSRRGKENRFEIIWVSRCRDMDSYGQYFTHMKWPALPPNEAMGQRGQMLFEKYKVKGIPSLVLLDDVGNVITLDARNKIPQDKAGIGFPWRNPLSNLYITVVPKSLRLMVKAQVVDLKDKLLTKIKSAVPLPVTK